MSAQNGSSKADTLVKAVLVLFISILAFSVGTFVGKNISDGEHRRMALEGEYKTDRSVASTQEHGEAATDQEVESLTEEFVNKEKAAAAGEAEPAAGSTAETTTAATSTEEGYKSYTRTAPRQPSSAAHAETPAGTPAAAATAPPPADAAAVPVAKPAKPKTLAAKHPSAAPNVVMGHSPAADKVANDEAPTDGMAEAKKAMPTLPSVASSAVGKFTVQVASYADEKEAKEQAASLKGKGWNAFYLPATVSGKTWYRVLVGLFNNDKSAKEFRTQFMKETNTKSAIVQKIIQ